MTDKQLWTAFDENYFYPAVVALASARKNLLADLVVNVAYDSQAVSEKSIEGFVLVMKYFGIQVNFHPIDLPPHLPILGHITSITFGRLELLRILKTPFIWIDADTFYPKGISDFLEYSKKIPVGMNFTALPSPIPSEGSNGAPNAAVVAAGSRYFNAGVFVADPVIWRKRELGEAWLGLLKQYHELGFLYLDQCMMNYLLAGDYNDLPRRFNFIPKRLEESEEDLCVIHYAGPLKPWVLQISQLREFFGTSIQASCFRKYYRFELAIFCQTLMAKRFEILGFLLKYKFRANCSFLARFFHHKFIALIGRLPQKQNLR